MHLKVCLHWNLPCSDADETKGKVKDSSEEVSQWDVVGKVTFCHHGVAVVAIEQVGVLHEALQEQGRTQFVEHDNYQVFVIQT